MSIKIVTLYEPQSTDGYRSFGEGVYFKIKTLADNYAKNKHKSYAYLSEEHKAIVDGEDYYLLKSEFPVYVEGSEKADEQKRKSALSKLSEEDKKVLGLC